MSNRIFVFVVCGSSQHIETLHFSLNYIGHFSKHRIIVVTDSTRNEISIIHENIVDIKTPEELNSHQASIWLKTSLNKILPKGPLYCYLDSDVIAINSCCDEVFDNYKAPVTFAADHCTIAKFSPYAVNCGCIESYEKEKSEIEDAISSVINHTAYPPKYDDPITRDLFTFMSSVQKKPISNIGIIIKIIIAYIFGKTKLNSFITIDFKRKEWLINNKSYPILLLYRKQIKKQTGYSFSFTKKAWLLPSGKLPAKNQCNHLVEFISNRFKTKISDLNWQHWNGGVFLFGPESDEFMDTWHKKTLEIFEDNKWKTRDQGTLIATLWEMNLQNHPLLSSNFNLIADFYNPTIIAFTEGDKLKVNINNEIWEPFLIHVYHEFGNENWSLWKEIQKRNPENK